jgi:hypothetical protein
MAFHSIVKKSIGYLIETGRFYNIERNMCTCNVCYENLIEDEYHFILICKQYDNIEDEYHFILVCKQYDNIEDEYHFILVCKQYDKIEDEYHFILVCKQYDNIEDEYHFILVCKQYDNIRKIYIKSYYWRRPSSFKFVQLLSVHSVK